MKDLQTCLSKVGHRLSILLHLIPLKCDLHSQSSSSVSACRPLLPYLKHHLNTCQSSGPFFSSCCSFLLRFDGNRVDKSELINWLIDWTWLSCDRGWGTKTNGNTEREQKKPKSNLLWKKREREIQRKMCSVGSINCLCSWTSCEYFLQ